MQRDTDPFVMLQQLAERSVASARGLPAQVEITPTWSGVGFRLGGLRMVAPMGEVSEILTLPAATHLPNVQPWVRGVANVRGRLLPLIDLEAFFDGSLEGAARTRRVLVLENGDFYSGLIVNAVYGMQHFPIDTFTDTPEPQAQRFSSYLAGSYRLEGETWSVFSPYRLLCDNRFANAAA